MPRYYEPEEDEKQLPDEKELQDKLMTMLGGGKQK